MEKFRRKVPVGIRPLPGHVPSTVFNKQSPQSGNHLENGVYHLEELRAQKRAQNELRSVEKRKDLEMLSSYNPWGKPGGGAPRDTGPQINKLDKSLNESEKSLGSFADYLNKPGPGCGAPKRTISGNPTGTMHVHPDIRNEDAAGILNEMTRKRKSNPTTQQGPPQSQVDASGNWNIRDSTDAGDQRHHKSHVLNEKQHSDSTAQYRLKEKLDEQIAEKNIARANAKSTAVSPHKECFGGFGKVGNVLRDSSGKIAREEPLTHRGATYLREYYNMNGEQSIVDQFGRPGPGVPVRTDSGQVHSWPRGKPLESEDPFRPGNCANGHQVFPVGIENEAYERALRRSSDSISVTKHTIENGYYEGGDNGTVNEDPRFKTEKPVGTVYSAMLRNQESYLTELRKQIDDNSVVRQKQKEESRDEEFKHFQHSLDCFGRPGNGAPRLVGGSLNTNRSKMGDMEGVAEGIRNPGTFRVT